MRRLGETGKRTSLGTPSKRGSRGRAAALVAIGCIVACGGPARSTGSGRAISPAPSAPVAPAAPTPSTTGEAPAPPGALGPTAHVPAGTLRIGSEFGKADERPVHQVHVEAFDMDLTEVTVAQYAACVRAGACRAAGQEVEWPGATEEDQRLYDGMCNGDRPDRQNHPINCVDWSAADTYCRWAGGRLPTEEEWEYAACGGECGETVKSGAGRRFFMGSNHWPLTGPIAKGPPAAFGLYDMAGSVWEWTASAYCTYDHPGCGDPRRVVRGGSWSVVDYAFVRLTDRSPSAPTTRNTSIGFRCAVSR